MRTPLVLLAVAAVALGPAAAASAKEIDKVKVCGADGCHDVTDRASMAVTDGGPPTAWPDTATPFYRIKISVKVPEGEDVPGWSFLWVPAAELIAQEDGTWTNPPSTTVDELSCSRAASSRSRPPSSRCPSRPPRRRRPARPRR